jgi:phospholipid transport system substrate-binding protein
MMPRALRPLCLLALFLLPLFARTGACAENAGAEARGCLELKVRNIFAILESPGFAEKASRPEYRMRIEKEVAEIFDFGEFSSRTVGARWRQFTPEQQRRFVDAFAALLKSTYLDRIDGYNGEQVVYTGEAVSPKGDRVEVRTTLRMKDGKVIPVSYRMLPKGSAWVVYDVIVENISMVMNYRTQFEDLLRRGNPEELIGRILEKAQKTREHIDGD